jgi:CHAD domain-containing protein
MTVRHLRDSVWLKRLDGLDRLWKDAQKGNPEGVHKLRVASRRIREALPILSDGNHPHRVRRMQRAVRALTRTLGPVRECDVSLILLTEFERRYPENFSAIQLVRQAVTAQRRERHDLLREHLDSVAPAEFSRKLIKATKRKKKNSPLHTRESPNPGDSDDRWRVALAARIVRRSKQLEQVVEYAGALYAPDRLHGVRVSVKKLRYALELGQEARLARLTSAIRFMKKMQDNLGELHDREMLLDRVRTIHAGQGHPAFSDSLERLTRLLEEETRHYHAQYVSHREDLLKLCAGVRLQASDIAPIGRSVRKRVAKVSHRTSGPRIAADRASRL